LSSGGHTESDARLRLVLSSGGHTEFDARLRLVSSSGGNTESEFIDLINVSLETSLYVVGYEKPWLERSVIDLNSEEEDHDSGDSERAYINSNEKDNTDYKNSECSSFPGIMRT
jgi:hypothetical protein